MPKYHEFHRVIKDGEPARITLDLKRILSVTEAKIVGVVNVDGEKEEMDQAYTEVSYNTGSANMLYLALAEPYEEVVSAWKMANMPQYPTRGSK